MSTSATNLKHSQCGVVELFHTENIVTLNSRSGSLKVTGNGSIRKLEYGFLFQFHSNYGPTLYHFEIKNDIGRKLIFHTLPAFDAEYSHKVWTVWYGKKLQRCGAGYRTVKCFRYVYSF